MSFISSSKIVFFLVYIYLFIGLIESQTNYNCNVHSSLIPLLNSQTNCTNSPPNQTQQCQSIQACLNYFNNLHLSMKDKISIYLTNTKYNAEGNCNLVIKFPTTLFLSSSLSLDDGSLVNCEQTGSFITNLFSSAVINGVAIENAINSAIVVPPNGDNLTILGITGGFFLNNTGVLGGAIHMSYPNSLTLLNTTFLYNTAQYGGAIYAQNAVITYSNFSQNSAQFGGAIYSNEVFLRYSILDSNHATQGGAINSGDLNVEYTSFRNNSATQGGALYLASIFGNLNQFTLNSAKQGGAIALIESNVTNFLRYSTIEHNKATIEGGAIFIGPCSPESSIDLSHTKIMNNSAAVSGGAIYLNYTSPSYLINGTIEDNYIIGENSKDNGGSSSYDTDPYQEIGCDGSPGSNCNLCSIEPIILKSDSSNESRGSSGSSGSGNLSGSASLSGSNSGSLTGSSSNSDSSDSSDSSHGGNHTTPHPTSTPSPTNNCTQCLRLGGNCIYQNNATLCLMPKLCWHGQCSISVDGQYSCVCHAGYLNDQCTESNSTSSSSHPNDNSSSNSNPKNKKLMKALEITLPIVFGLLIILFLVTLYYMIRKKKSKIPYEPLN